MGTEKSDHLWIQQLPRVWWRIRSFLESKCEELEKCRGESRKMLCVLKELTNKWAPEDEDIKHRWKEYSTKLYKAKNHQQTYIRVGNKMNHCHSGHSEVEQALQQMRNGRSPGADDIPAEFWKASGEGAELLWQLCTKIWWEEKWPKDWLRVVFVPLPKKGNLKYSNYCTISLILHASKIMLRIIINRMKVKLEEEISIKQAGFREGRGTRDQVDNIRNIIEKCKEHWMPLYLCFIDYSEALDCVSHKIMKCDDHDKNGISKTSNRSGQQTIWRPRIRYENWSWQHRVVQHWKGTPRGVYSVTKSFQCVLRRHHERGTSWIWRKSSFWRWKNYRLEVCWWHHTYTCSSTNELMDLLCCVKEASEKGPLLNTKKTKIMVTDKQSSGEDFLLDGQVIEEVSEFGYLGSLINTKSDSTTEIKCRLAIARTTTQKMLNIQKSRGLSIDLSFRFLRATVLSIATYGCESWAPTKNDNKRIETFKLWCCRRLLRVSWKDKRTNNWVLEKIGSPSSLETQ